MKITFEELARDVLARKGNERRTVVDQEAGYFGAALETGSLVIPDQVMDLASIRDDHSVRTGSKG